MSDQEIINDKKRKEEKPTKKGGKRTKKQKEEEIEETPEVEMQQAEEPKEEVVQEGSELTKPGGECFVLKPAEAKKDPTDWDVVLTDEKIAEWKIERSAEPGDYSEGGFKVKFGEGKYNEVSWWSPPLKVEFAALHGVGVPKQGSSDDSARQFKLSASSTCDDDVAEADPSIRESQKQYDAQMYKAFSRLSALLFDEPNIKPIWKNDAWKQAMTVYLAGHQDVYPKFPEWSKKGIPPQVQEELKKIPEVKDSAIENFMTRLQNWRFKGTAKHDADPEDKEIYRAKTKVFWPKKKGSKSQENVRAKPKALGGQKGKVDYNQMKSLNDNEDQEHEEDDENEEGTVRDMSDAQVKRICDNVKGTHRYNQITWLNPDKTFKDLGAYAKDRNYRVADKGDYVRMKCSFWVYSNSGDNAAGARLQLASRVIFFRDGIKTDTFKETIVSPAARVAPLREKQLRLDDE